MKSFWVMRFKCFADGSPTAAAGQYLLDFQPVPPRGHLEVTPYLLQARRFDTMEALKAYWLTAIGTRPDGEPNRPLTAFTILSEEYLVPPGMDHPGLQ